MTEPSTEAARAATELVARASYGRLLGVLAAGSGDIALAEDALGTAFERALTTWPERGVPENPEGWLITVARNARRDVWKSAATRMAQALDTDELEVTGDVGDLRAGDAFAAADADEIGDKRLELLFVCAHPAIDPAIRSPLMLQTCLGFDAAQVATVFGVKPATMAQRLVRAKKRIKDVGIRFVVPTRTDLPDRLAPVLEAIYGCYALTWRERASDPVQDLAAEAQYLAVTLAALLQDEPEAWSLAALITYSLARAGGRTGHFVPLDQQDPTTWDAALITEADGYLHRAARPGQAPGRFQLEAAIQAVHSDRVNSGEIDWAALRTLYSALVLVAPTLGARVAAASVLGRTDGPDAGLAALREIEAGTVQATQFQPYVAARADLLARAGSPIEAAEAFDTAAELTADPAVAQYLRRRAALALGTD